MQLLYNLISFKNVYFLVISTQLTMNFFFILPQGKLGEKGILMHGREISNIKTGVNFGLIFNSCICDYCFYRNNDLKY